MIRTALRIRSWTTASEAEKRSGLIGYLTVEYGDLILDSIVLRRTADGRFTLSFPVRTDRQGRRHPYVRPIDDEARRVVEREILTQLGQHMASATGQEPDNG